MQPYNDHIYVCESWHEIRDILPVLKSNEGAFGDLPLLLIDYNRTIVFPPYYALLINDNRVDNVLAYKIYDRFLANAPKYGYPKYYEGEVAAGVQECISEFHANVFFSFVITLGDPSLHNFRSAKIEEAGLNKYISFQKDVFDETRIPEKCVLRKHFTLRNSTEYDSDGLEKIEFVYQDGHVYCGPNGDDSKGEALAAFSDLLKQKPSYVVLVDDLKVNLESVYKECKRAGIPFLGINIKLAKSEAMEVRARAAEGDKKAQFILDIFNKKVREIESLSGNAQ
jgi:hypothetical protein